VETKDTELPLYAMTFISFALTH